MTGFGAELLELQRRIERARHLPAEDDLRDVLLADLETAHEELRVAAEEVRVQQDELDRLLQHQLLGTWQHERLLAVLPAAVVVTDDQGRIHTVNAAAAAMLRMRVDRLLRKPLQSFVDYSDRAELRRNLARAVASGNEFRTKLTVLPRGSEPRSIHVVASVARNSLSSEVDVTWLLLAPDPTRSVGASGPSPATRALVELTKLPLHSTDDAEIVRRTAAICAEGLGPGASVTVVVGSPASPRVLASTDVTAQQIDGVQVITDDGPAMLAWECEETVATADIRADERWPGLRERLAALEVRGAVCVPLRVGDDAMGVLNVYLRESGGDDDTTAVAKLLGTAVGAILHEIELKGELESLAGQLRTALESRAQIEQAKGILMAARRCNADEAFTLLVEMSSRQNKKLREIAARLVSEARAPQERTSSDV